MSTINDIIEATRAKFCPSIYHNYGGLNVLADELAVVQDTSNIFALFVQSTSSTPVVEGRSVSEEYTLSVAFCKLMPSDSYDAEQVERDYIASCKDMAQMWLSWLIANYPRLRILATSANREYLRYDAILCGYSLTMQIKEYSVNYTCLIKPTPVPQYERILKKMPQNLRSALLVWYCPKLQGLTNAQLAENSGYYKGGLHDLSGNGYDADIFGMSGRIGDGYMNERCELVFDGVDDIAECTKDFDFENFDLTIKGTLDTISSNKRIFQKNYTSAILSASQIYTYIKGATTNTVLGTMIGNNQLRLAVNDDVAQCWKNGISTPRALAIGTNVDKTSLYVGGSATLFSPYTLEVFLIFTRQLTNEEVSWVQYNMINF